jgi:hypothetical protein
MRVNVLTVDKGLDCYLGQTPLQNALDFVCVVF